MVLCALGETSARIRMSNHEKDVSTQQHESQTHARLPGADEDRGRPGRHQTPARQGPQAPQRPHPAQAGAPLTRHSVRCSFPKSARLLVRREFLHIQKRGKRRHTRHFLVITAPARTDRPRLGITASRKFGNAVARNSIKRRLREFFRVRQTDIAPERDILIIPKSQAKTLPFAELAAELDGVIPWAHPQRNARANRSS